MQGSVWDRNTGNRGHLPQQGGQAYVERQKDSLNRQALFADETQDYRRPEEPDTGDLVCLRFRTARDNVDHVYYIEEETETRKEMARVSSDSLFDYYQHHIIADEVAQYYYFQVVRGEETVCYNRLGVVEEPEAEASFRITPGFHTPEWAKGVVMYQIFVDRFCRGDKTNDVVENEYVYVGRPVHFVEDWDRNPSTMDVGCFYGGDLQGVWDKLDYLQDLGIEVIYFNPLFVSPSNHKYDTQDYEHIDPHYGVIVKDGGECVAPQARTNEGATRYQIRSADPENLEASDRFFARFVEEVHRRGMRVIMDGVFNHCGSFNKWMDRERIYASQGGYAPGAYLDEKSPYRMFFRFGPNSKWPDNGHYESWWGFDTLPKLNYEESEALVHQMLEIARKWVSAPYYADGWRLDVASDLGHKEVDNHQFWREFRTSVKEANPQALILAEHYGDPRAWLEGDQWDTIMNYDAFMEPVSWFLTGMEKHSDEYREELHGDGDQFFTSMAWNMSRMQTQSVMTAMNQLSNHDHSRFLTRTNHKEGRIGTAGPALASEGINLGLYREAVLVQMTWPGAPTLYYGDETGVCGWTDPDNRRTFPWGRENYELIEFHKYLISIHKRLPALRRGSVIRLLSGRNLIAYGRMRGTSLCAVAVNCGAEPQYVELPVWLLGAQDGTVFQRVMMTTAQGYDSGRVARVVEDGRMALELPGYCGVLLGAGEEM